METKKSGNLLNETPDNLKKEAQILSGFLKKLEKSEINKIDDLRIYLTSKCFELNCKDVLSKLTFKKRKTKIFKRQIIQKFPEIFVIRIEKIIEYNNDFGAKITNNKSDIPVEINVIEDDKNVKYELYSFLQHMGSSEYGHYISFKKFSKEMWVVINDSDFKKVNVMQIKNMDPYILFYRRLPN